MTSKPLCKDCRWAEVEPEYRGSFGGFYGWKCLHPKNYKLTKSLVTGETIGKFEIVHCLSLIHI